MKYKITIAIVVLLVALMPFFYYDSEPKTEYKTVYGQIKNERMI